MNYLTNLTTRPVLKNELLSPVEIQQNESVFELEWNSHNTNYMNVIIPLLKQLAKQPCWQLWITGSYKINRSWFKQSSLPTNHIIQAAKLNSSNAVNVALRALESRNFNSVILWQIQLTAQDKRILQAAALKNQAYIFIINKGSNLSYQH